MKPSVLVLWMIAFTFVINCDANVSIDNGTKGNSTENNDSSGDGDGDSPSTAEEIVTADKDSLTLVFGGTDSAESLTTDLELIQTGESGLTVISWVSSQSDYLNNNGQVNRPSFAEGDQTVTLTATITMEDFSDTKEFVVIVKAVDPTNSEKVAADSDILAASEFTFSGGDSSQGVSQNFSMPTTGTYGSNITWTESSDAAGVLSLSGSGNSQATVTPGAGLGYDVVTVTATITSGGSTVTKEISLNVIRTAPGESEEAIMDMFATSPASLSYASGDSAEQVTTDFSLPTNGPFYNSSITWSEVEDAGNHISISGNSVSVSNPSFGKAKAVVKLKATVTNGASVSQRVITLHISPNNDSDGDGVANSSDACPGIDDNDSAYTGTWYKDDDQDGHLEASPNTRSCSDGEFTIPPNKVTALQLAEFMDSDDSDDTVPIDMSTATAWNSILRSEATLSTDVNEDGDTADSAYLIFNKEQWDSWVGQTSCYNIIVMRDIDCTDCSSSFSNHNFGSSSFCSAGGKTVFDGQNHRVVHRPMFGSGSNYFGGLWHASNSELYFKNFDLEINAVLTANNRQAGGLVGYMNDTLTIKNVTVRGFLYSESSRTGGLVGDVPSNNHDITIENAVNKMDIVVGGSDTSGANEVGVAGIMGDCFAEPLIISKTANEGNIIAYGSSSKYKAGGICGTAWNYGVRNFSISEVYNTGTIQGYNFAGGIIGTILSDTGTSSTLENCYNLGATSYVDAQTYSASSGIIGSSGDTANLTVENCYSAGIALGLASIGNANGIKYNAGGSAGTYTNNYYLTGTIDSSLNGLIDGLDSDQDTNPGAGSVLSNVNMAAEASFTGFNFSTTWEIDEGSSYPYLKNRLPGILPGN